MLVLFHFLSSCSVDDDEQYFYVFSSYWIFWWQEMFCYLLSRSVPDALSPFPSLLGYVSAYGILSYVLSLPLSISLHSFVISLPMCSVSLSCWLLNTAAGVPTKPFLIIPFLGPFAYLLLSWPMMCMLYLLLGSFYLSIVAAFWKVGSSLQPWQLLGSRYSITLRCCWLLRGYSTTLAIIGAFFFNDYCRP